MNKEKMNILTAMLNAFVQDYASRFGIPELIGREFPVSQKFKEESKSHEVKMEEMVQFRPSGQFSSMVRKAWVTFGARMDAYGRIEANANIRYDHFSGGSNGTSVAYAITYRSITFGPNEPMEYMGFIPHDQYHELLRAHNKAIEAIRKENEQEKA